MELYPFPKRSPTRRCHGLFIITSAPRGLKTDVDTIRCQRCRRDTPKLDKPPFKNSLGERIQAAICQSCWADWLEHQTVLINHHGLDPRNPKAREFLYEQIEKVLLKGEGGEEIDTSRKGTIEY